jgi:hypothetical protein
LSKRFSAQNLAVLGLCLCSVFLSAQQSPSSATPSGSAPASSPSSGGAAAGSSSQGQQASPPAQPSDSTHQQSSSEKEKDQGTLGEIVPQKKTGPQTTNGTSNDRLFYALPNFLTLENGANLPPLTVKQKFAVVARGSFDYVQYPWYGFLAGLSQAENSEPGYGQGAEGYGKRYGAAFADGTIENFMTGAVLPSVLHQDPRYFQLGHGSFMHRVIYAASRNLITRTDDRRSQFNYSEVVGGAIAAFISTYSYHPSADKTVSNTMSVWGTQYGYDTITLVVKEFWPDIRRKLARKRPGAAPQPGKQSQ